MRLIYGKYTGVRARRVLVFDTRRRQSWRTRQAASPLSGCARKRRDKHTPFLNFGKINRQRAKICADPLANSSPFSLSSYILLIPYPHYRRFPLLYSVYFQVIFKRLKIFICNRRVCLFFIRERARARMRTHIILRTKYHVFLPFFQG